MNEQILNEARVMIAGFIRDRRKELKMSQLELAELTGMGIATIRRFESGNYWINMKQYLVICHHLKCYPFMATMEGDEEFSKMMRERWMRPDENN